MGFSDAGMSSIRNNSRLRKNIKQKYFMKQEGTSEAQKQAEKIPFDATAADKTRMLKTFVQLAFVLILSLLLTLFLFNQLF